MMGKPWQPACLSHPCYLNWLGPLCVGEPADKTHRIPDFLWHYRPEDGLKMHPQLGWMGKVYIRVKKVPVLVSLPFCRYLMENQTPLSVHQTIKDACVCARVCVCVTAWTLLSSVFYVLPEEMLGLLQNGHKSKTYSLSFFVLFFFIPLSHRDSVWSKIDHSSRHGWIETSLMGSAEDTTGSSIWQTSRLPFNHNALLTDWDGQVWLASAMPSAHSPLSDLTPLSPFCSHLVNQAHLTWNCEGNQPARVVSTPFSACALMSRRK